MMRLLLFKRLLYKVVVHTVVVVDEADVFDEVFII